MLSQATRKKTNNKVNPPLTCSVLKSGTPRKHCTVGKKVKRKTHLSSISRYLSLSDVRSAVHHQPEYHFATAELLLSGVLICRYIATTNRFELVFYPNHYSQGLTLIIQSLLNPNLYIFSASPESLQQVLNPNHCSLCSLP